MSDRVHVHLVRHGEVENPASIRYGRLAGFRLSPSGRAQVERTAQHLASLSPRVTIVTTSPLERARETADVIAARLGATPASIDARLTEASSRFDGLPRRFTLLRYAVRHAATLLDTAPESPAAVALRMRGAVLDLATHGEAIVLVSHQLPIQYVRFAFQRDWPARSSVASRLRLQFGIIPKARCHYASITSLVLESGALIDVRYIEP